MDAIHSHDPASLVPPIAVYSFVHSLTFTPASPSQLLGYEDSADGDTWAGMLHSKQETMNQANALDSIILSFLAFNSSYSITLNRKSDLFADALDWLYIDGKPAPPTAIPVIYEGFVTGHKHDSSARMIMHNHENGNPVFEGSFSTSTDGLYNLKSVASYSKSKRPVDIELASAMSRGDSTRDSAMILFHDSGIEPPFMRSPESALRRRSKSSVMGGSGSSCGFNNAHPWNSGHTGVYNPHPFDATVDQTGKKFSYHRRDGGAVPGCKGTKQFVFMGAAADCNYVSAQGGTPQALAQILSDFNQASAIYEASFQVGLAIIKVNLQTACSKSGDTVANGASMAWNQDCTDSYSISNRLSDFSQWRGAKDKTPDNAGLWHLLTGCTTAVSGQAVGIAWLQTLCQQGSNTQADVTTGGTDYVSGTAVSSIVPVEWKVVAHEVGHNFGAIHDCTAATCPGAGTVCCACSPTCDCGGQYLMHPTDNAISSNFSACSVKDICNTLQDPSRYSCLQPPGALQALTTNICGNGVKEAGEDCDCGGPDCGKTDPCCNGATCKFTPFSVCDDTNDDCCTQCQYKAQGAVCRTSTGVCDYAEVCTGDSGDCPVNLFAPNGQTCATGIAGQSGTACANGVCTSRDLQCTTNSNGLKTTGVCQMPGSNTQCQLLCASTSGQCYILAGNMLDGTACGYAGSCFQGSCKESSWFGSFVDLFMSNLQLSIPLAIGAGLLLLGCMWSLCGCCIRQARYGSTRKNRPTARALPVVHAQPTMVQPYQQPLAYQQQQSGGYQGNQESYQRSPPHVGQDSFGRGPAFVGSDGSQVLSVRSGSGGAGTQQGSSGRGQGGWVDASKYNGDLH
ncbi:hypothetical protein HDU98_010067 [Podochytrium sp. JEL0797]|nr:hypothetical protein HDU98_010067 [Podochytrium sp. JEL0797]